MLEKMLVLLERFVVAHELIAANSAKNTIIEKVGDIVVATETVAEPEQKAPAKRTRAAKPKAEAKAKGAPDLDTLRQEIKDAAIKIAEEGTDKCCDEFDDLLADYKVRNVSKLQDDDIEDFHADLEELAAKYFELED